MFPCNEMILYLNILFLKYKKEGRQFEKLHLKYFRFERIVLFELTILLFT